MRNWPPVREVCLNYEVVFFQPWTVNPTHLGSVAYRYTFNVGLLPHLFPLFSGSFFFLLLPPASPCLAIHHQRPLFFRPLPTSSPGVKCCPHGHRLYPPPATDQPPPLFPAPHDCDAAVSMMVRSPLCSPRPVPRFLSYPW